MTEKHRGAQPGNENAKRVNYERIILSLREADFSLYVREFQEQYGHVPEEADIKALLKRTLREGKKEFLHLYVRIKREDAGEVRKQIENLFGQVRAISLRDSWFSDTGERTIYYQRILKESEVDPTVFEPWEIEEMKKQDLSHEAIWAKVQELQKNNLVIQVEYDITTNPLPERW